MVVLDLLPAIRRAANWVLEWVARRERSSEKRLIPKAVNAVSSKSPLMLSKYFSRDEMKCKCGCNRIGPYDKNLKQLLEQLDKLREKIGKPIHITSGYRCPTHNRAVGGATNSFHMQDMAADIYVEGMDEWTLVLKADQLFGGIGLYQRSNGMGWVHVDIGPYGFWKG